jgi:hypothetical protein
MISAKLIGFEGGFLLYGNKVALDSHLWPMPQTISSLLLLRWLNFRVFS